MPQADRVLIRLQELPEVLFRKFIVVAMRLNIEFDATCNNSKERIRKCKKLNFLWLVLVKKIKLGKKK